jgi:uncharacterized membrane protein YfcA
LNRLVTLSLPDPFVFACAAAVIFIISFTKGAFGGGVALLGIPLLSLAMDPITGGVFLAPMFIAMDVFALRYWRPSTWSRPDVVLLIPGVIVGIGIGFILMRVLDRHFVAILIAVTALAFTALWLRGGRSIEPKPRSRAKAIAAGTGSGITSMVAHSGGPPLAMYLLPLGLPKSVYAGTTSVVFSVANVVKAGPWLVLAPPDADLWLLMALTVPFIPLGVWLGWVLHLRLDQPKLIAICYGVLALSSLKLLFDGLRGYGLI